MYICAKSQLMSYSSSYCMCVALVTFSMHHYQLPPWAGASLAQSEIHTLDFIFDCLAPLPWCSLVVVCHCQCPQCLSWPVPPPAPLLPPSPELLALGQGRDLGVSAPACPGHHSGWWSWSHWSHQSSSETFWKLCDLWSVWSIQCPWRQQIQTVVCTSSGSRESTGIL